MTGSAQTQCWFPARTSTGQEVGIKRRLAALGVESFIPTEKRRGYRGQMCERAVISNLVFVRATKQTACSLRTDYGLPLNYLFDYASHTMMRVPDKQMGDFVKVFEAGSLSEGGLVDVPLSLGEKVRVTRGPLKGVEGNVLELQGRYYVVVGLCGCIFARARVARSCLEKC